MSLARHIARATFVVACFAVCPAPAHAAQGLNLAWTHCFSDLGVQNRTFACNTNSGNSVLFGSFVLASDFPQLIGTEIVLQLAADSPSLPAWWQLKNTGSCRQTSLNANFVADPNDINCHDWSLGGSAGGVGAYCVVGSGCSEAPHAVNTAMIKVIHAVPQNLAADLTCGLEYYDFT